MTACFIGTNVFLDILLNRSGGKEVAQFFKECQTGHFRLVTSVSCIQTTLYMLERGEIEIEKRRTAGKHIGKLVSTLHTTSEMVIAAMDLKFNDLEDAILWQTAIESDCQWFITQNKRDFPTHPTTEVLSVSEALERLSTKTDK